MSFILGETKSEIIVSFLSSQNKKKTLTLTRKTQQKPPLASLFPRESKAKFTTHIYLPEVKYSRLLVNLSKKRKQTRTKSYYFHKEQKQINFKQKVEIFFFSRLFLLSFYQFGVCFFSKF